MQMASYVLLQCNLDLDKMSLWSQEQNVFALIFNDAVELKPKSCVTTIKWDNIYSDRKSYEANLPRPFVLLTSK